MKKLISIISGCYNEEDNLNAYYEAIKKQMDSLPQYRFECIIADNCSKDRSPQMLEKLAAKDRRFKVILNLKNYGPMRSGMNMFRRARGDAVISLPCDLQEPPELIPVFLEKWEAGNKVVWGQYEKTAENFLMGAARRLFYRIIRLMAENEEIERANGFGLYDREVVDWINQKDLISLVRNYVVDLGYKPCLIPYRRRARAHGKSSYSLRRYVRTALSSLVMTSKLPLRLSTYLGLLTAGINIIVALFYLVSKLINWSGFDAGIAPIVIGIFFLGAVQLICIGMVGEYVGSLLTLVRRVPLVIEQRTLNFEEKSEPSDDAAAY